MVKRWIFAAAALALGPMTFLAPMTALAQAQPAPAHTFTGVYNISFRGLPAGEASYSINVSGSQYSATSSQRATGIARAAVSSSQDYASSARGVINAQGVRPATYQHQGGRRNRLVRVAFSSTDAITTATPPFGSMGNPPATPAQKAGSLDNLSAFVAMTMAPGVADPCARTIRVFDGRARFDFVMTPNGRQSVNTRAFRGSAFRCRVEFRPVAGFTDPPAIDGPMSFVFAPLENGMFLPVRIEFPTDDGVAVLQIRTASTTGPRLPWR